MEWLRSHWLLFQITKFNSQLPHGKFQGFWCPLLASEGTECKRCTDKQMCKIKIKKSIYLKINKMFLKQADETSDHNAYKTPM